MSDVDQPALPPGHGAGDPVIEVSAVQPIPGGAPESAGEAAAASGSVSHPALPDAMPGVPPRRRRRAVTAVVSGVATLVLLAGGGAVAARMWYGSTGALPESAVPASTAAFVRINLTPGYSQRLKLLALIKRFPAASATSPGTAAPDPVQTYEARLLNSMDAGLSAGDVNRWFDDRAGVGAWADSRSRPMVLAVLASHDDAAARTTLGKARNTVGGDHFGYVVSDGYALLAMGDTGAQAAADEAARAAHQRSLADNPQFRTAAAALPPDQAILAYADLRQAGHLTLAAAKAAQAASKDPAASSIDITKAMPGLDHLTGYLVTGVRAADDGIEIRSRTIGMTHTATGGPDARAALAALPANTALGAVTGGLGDTTGFNQLGTVLGGGLITPYLGGIAGDPGAAADQPVTGPTDPSLAQPSLGPDGKLHLVGPDGKPIVIDPNDPSTFPADAGTDSTPTTDPTRNPAEEKALRDAAEALMTALGSAKSISLALTGAPPKPDALPALALTVHLDQPRQATTFADNLTTAITNGMGLPPGHLSVEPRGDAVQVHTPSYTPAGATLASQPLFNQAMVGASANTTTAVYMDVHQLATVAATSPDTMRWLDPVKAVGISAGHSGNDTTTLIRIIIG